MTAEFSRQVTRSAAWRRRGLQPGDLGDRVTLDHVTSVRRSVGLSAGDSPMWSYGRRSEREMTAAWHAVNRETRVYRSLATPSMQHAATL